MKRRILPFLVATSMATLAGCGGSGGGESSGGGSGGSVSGLDMPSTLSVVTAKEGATGGRVMGLKAGYRAVLAALDDPNSDFAKDPTRTYVWDRSIESLSTVNMILCVMDQTRAADMVNQGAYIALVNTAKCETGKNQSSSGQNGQSSSGQVKEFEKWTIESTRADNSSPMYVKIWIPRENKGGNTSAQGDGSGANPMDEQQILVETVVTEAVSETNPFGSFTLNFKGVVDGSVVGAPDVAEAEMMKGTLFTVSNSASKPEFKFIEIAGDAMDGGSGNIGFSHESSTHVLLDDADGNSGQAMTHMSESFSYDDPMDNPDAGMITDSHTETFAVAFNPTHFKRFEDVTDETACTSRTEFNTNVWRYNLYHAADGTFNGNAVTAGQRVELNSGFPFTYNGKFGHVGYWGVWYEGGTLADGTTIQKVDFSTNTTTDYQVHVAPGRLIHRMASQELLSQYQNDYEFSYWGAHPTLLDGSSNPLYGQWHVKVNSSNNFEVVDTFTWGDTGPVSSTTIDHDSNSGTAEVSVVAEFAPDEGEYLWLWSDALGGNITYVHKSDVDNDGDSDTDDVSARTVTLYSQEYVLPNDAALFGAGDSFTVYCYDRCVKGGLTQDMITAMNSESELFHPPLNVDWMTNPPTMTDSPYAYTVERSGGKVIVKDHTGAVVSADGLDLSKFGYDWGLNTAEMVISQAGINVPWDVFQAADSYRWETGSNQWNQQVTVTKVSDGTYATFDKPLEFDYTHSTANDANGDATFDGKKFRLQYGGPGELWGFPWSEDDNGRWHAAFTLADGATLSNSANDFVVKGMEKEQTMKDVDVAECATLNVDGLATSLPLPTTADIGTISFTLADKPNVTAAPAVIEGELQ